MDEQQSRLLKDKSIASETGCFSVSSELISDVSPPVASLSLPVPALVSPAVSSGPTAEEVPVTSGKVVVFCVSVVKSCELHDTMIAPPSIRSASIMRILFNLKHLRLK